MALQQNSTSRLWRVAGGLAVAHIVLVFTAVAFEKQPELGASAGTREAAFVHSSIGTVLAGGYVEYVGGLVFLVGGLLVARLLRGSSALAGWLSSCVAAAAVTYTAINLSTGFPAGAAAIYDGHRGVDLDVLTTVNDVRIFAFYLSLGVLGVFALAVAASARATGVLPGWLSYAGFAIGVLCVASPALQGITDAVNFSMLLWFVWFLALGVVALRGPRTADQALPESVTV